MSIKKFIISSGDGTLEESELDLSGKRTIGYDDVSKRVQLSNAYVIDNLFVSGSIFGNITGSISGTLNGGDVLNKVFTEGNITGSGKEDDKVRLKDSITILGDLTASNAYVTNRLIVNGTASIANLETLNQQSLAVGDKYIVIMSGGIDHVGLDGAGILWGSASSGPTVDENGANAYIKYRNLYDKLEIYPGLVISGSVSASSGITGSFKGDGSNITGLIASQVSGIISSVFSSGNIDGDGTINSPIILKDSISLNSVSASLSGSGLYIYDITASNIRSFQSDVQAKFSSGTNINYQTGTIALNNNISLNSVSASFSGSGASIYNITGSNWAGSVSGFATDVRNQLSGGANITFQTGTIALNNNISLNSISASFSGSGASVYNITGSNWAGGVNGFVSDVRNQLSGGANITFQTGTVALLNDITLNTVTASFSGDGSKLTNIPSGAVNLSSYARLDVSNSLTGSQYISGSVSASAGITGSFSGSGALLNNLTGSSINFPNFQIDVRNQLSAGSNITYQTGTIALNNNINIGSITGSFSGSFYGDASTLINIYPKIKFTTSAGLLSVGDIVSISASGLSKANNTSDILSNAFGVVASSGSGEVYVQTSGEIELNSINVSYTTGSVIYVDGAGQGTLYENIPSGGYITQIGYVTGNGAKKIVIVPRVFGQKA